MVCIRGFSKEKVKITEIVKMNVLMSKRNKLIFHQCFQEKMIY